MSFLLKLSQEFNEKIEETDQIFEPAQDLDLSEEQILKEIDSLSYEKVTGFINNYPNLKGKLADAFANKLISLGKPLVYQEFIWQAAKEGYKFSPEILKNYIKLYFGPFFNEIVKLFFNQLPNTDDWIDSLLMHLNKIDATYKIIDSVNFLYNNIENKEEFIKKIILGWDRQGESISYLEAVGIELPQLYWVEKFNIFVKTFKEHGLSYLYDENFKHFFVDIKTRIPENIFNEGFKAFITSGELPRYTRDYKEFFRSCDDLLNSDIVLFLMEKLISARNKVAAEIIPLIRPYVTDEQLSNFTLKACIIRLKTNYEYVFGIIQYLNSADFDTYLNIFQKKLDVPKLNLIILEFIQYHPSAIKKIQFITKNLPPEVKEYLKIDYIFHPLHPMDLDLDVGVKNIGNLLELSAKKNNYLFPLITSTLSSNIRVVDSYHNSDLSIDILHELDHLIEFYTPEELYHGVIKQNPALLKNIYVKLNDYKEEYDKLTISNYKDPDDLCVLIKNKSKNPGEYFKYMDRLFDLCEIEHNNEAFDTPEMFEQLLFSKRLDLKQDFVEHFLQITKEMPFFFRIFYYIDNPQHYDPDTGLYGGSPRTRKVLDTVSAVKNLSEKNIIDYSRFKELLTQFKTINVQNLTPTPEILNLLKELTTIISTITNYKAIAEYYEYSEPKNPNLFKLNLSFDSFDFKVLETNDPKHFSIGLDTDCCQRIGGVGENAAIDSFINPLAGVLVLSKNGKILAQSYFHYVPNDSGFILDNIEINEKNVMNFGFDLVDDKSNDLAKLYLEYGERIKQQNPDIKYIKVGLSYTRISDSIFKKIKEEKDPRYFAVEDHLYEEAYSDYDESNHIDLFQPISAPSKVASLVRLASQFNLYSHPLFSSYSY